MSGEHMYIPKPPLLIINGYFHWNFYYSVQCTILHKTLGMLTEWVQGYLKQIPFTFCKYYCKQPVNTDGKSSKNDQLSAIYNALTSTVGKTIPCNSPEKETMGGFTHTSLTFPFWKSKYLGFKNSWKISLSSDSARTLCPYPEIWVVIFSSYLHRSEHVANAPSNT